MATSSPAAQTENTGVAWAERDRTDSPDKVSMSQPLFGPSRTLDLHADPIPRRQGAEILFKAVR